MSKSVLKQIIHIDMDCFYAQVEQVKHPELMEKPVIVGGSPKGRGVVATCSYEARKFGVKSAMPLAEAYRRCPEAFFLPVDMKTYREVSNKIRDIFYDYTPLVEPLSLDEAFLDVSDSTLLFGPAEDIARSIKERIKKELNLTASAGVAHNKFLAKIASDLKKPDGFVIVDPNNVEEFLDPLPISRVWGIGEKSAQKLHELNIHTIKQLRKLDEEYLAKLFGVIGRHLYLLVRGIDDRAVEVSREIKSIGRETTFSTDIANIEQLKTTILNLIEKGVGRSLRKEGLKGKTITLKIRYSDFSTLSRSITLAAPTNLDEVIYTEACSLLGKGVAKPVRLIGVTMKNFETTHQQMSLFSEESHPEREKLANVIDTVKDRFGDASITKARLLKPFK